MKVKFFLLQILFLASIALYAQDETKPFKPSKGMKNLSSLKKKRIELKVGQKAYVQYKQHGSVGIYGEVSSSDEAVLKKVDTHTAFKNKQEPGMTGADESVVTVIFEAVGKGKSQVKISNMFRGQTEKEAEISVIVK
ncbi:MAG: hypothetical protein SFU27_12875 [Thermonemataceae bacterium]|nr:hypothetical protein [Thermonemataceae bacterium]